MRIVLLIVAVVFVSGLGVLTLLDIVNYGVTWLDVLAVIVLVPLGVGTIGSLWQKPPPKE
jgi:hypothetical protein